MSELTRVKKRPESVLVVIYCVTTLRVLMLQRLDDLDFWQSVTGSVEASERPDEAAIREVWEETGIDILSESLTLIDANKQVEFEIFPQFRHRYAAGVTHNLEHWFYLPLQHMRVVQLTEHSAFQWMAIEQAAASTKSWNNAKAIMQIPIIENKPI